MTAPLRRVLTRRPAAGDFLAAGWRLADLVLLVRQHEAFCELLSSLGVEVTVAPAVEGLVDACYVFDPALVARTGAIVLRPPKPIRVAEPRLLELVV